MMEMWYCIKDVTNTSLVVPRKKNRLRIKALSFEELSSLDILLLVKPPRDQFINCGLLKTELSTWGGMFIYCFFSVLLVTSGYVVQDRSSDHGKMFLKIWKTNQKLSYYSNIPPLCKETTAESTGLGCIFAFVFLRDILERKKW